MLEDNQWNIYNSSEADAMINVDCLCLWYCGLTQHYCQKFGVVEIGLQKSFVALLTLLPEIADSDSDLQWVSRRRIWDWNCEVCTIPPQTKNGKSIPDAKTREDIFGGTRRERKQVIN